MIRTSRRPLRPFAALAAAWLTLALVSVPTTRATWQGASTFRSADILTHQVSGSSGYSPAQLTAAYDFTPLTDRGIDGTGQTIALIELGPFDPADIQAFDAANQLSDPTVREYSATGKAPSANIDGETTLDLEWAHALAPAATIQIYYLKNARANKAGWADVADTVTQAAKNGAGSISMSFGACVSGSAYKQLQKSLAAVEKRGASVFVSSGDFGAHPGPVKDCGSGLGVSYPATDPSVVAVGGTSLHLASDNSILSETAWRESGGGKGAPLLRPAWQIAPQLHPGKYRWAPDVAFLGDTQTGAQEYFNGSWGVAGGTSLGAPAWAAIWTLVRQDAQKAGKTISPAPVAVYAVANSTSYSLAFHDVVSGNNGRYQAAPGWDPVTGWGTPDVANLITAVESGATVRAR